MTEKQYRLISTALQKVFRKLVDGAGPTGEDRQTADFVFQMSDWRDDLLALADLMKNPSGKSARQWNEAVASFLIHASGHVAAASRLAGFEPIEFNLPKRPGRSRRAASTKKR